MKTYFDHEKLQVYQAPLASLWESLEAARLGAMKPGRDAFHRVPNMARNASLPGVYIGKASRSVRVQIWVVAASANTTLFSDARWPYQGRGGTRPHQAPPFP